MIRLNEEQEVAVKCDGNVVITACPGSGKTRVLTARLIRGLSELSSGKQRVIASLRTEPLMRFRPVSIKKTSQQTVFGQELSMPSP